MRYLVVSVMLFLASNTFAAPEVGQLEKSLVTITFDQSSKKITQSGFVIGDGNQVVTYASEKIKGATALVSSNWSSKKLYSNSVKRSKLGLVVIHVAGLDGEPVHFSEAKLKGGQTIYSSELVSNKHTIRKGSVSSFHNWQKEEGFFSKKLVGPVHELFGHNISITKTTVGNPILDECGRIVGVARPAPKGFDRGKFALSSAQMISEIHTLSEIAYIDKERCLTAQEMAVQKEKERQEALKKAENAHEENERIVAENKKKEEELIIANQKAKETERIRREKDKELESVNERLKSAELEASQAESNLQNLEEKLKEASKKADLTEQEKNKLESDAELARINFEKTQAELKAAEEKKHSLQTDIDELVAQMDDERIANEEKLKKYAMLVAGLLFLVIVIALMLGNRKKARIKQAESRASEAEQAAKLAEEEKTKYIAPFDCLLEGEDTSGKRYYLKIDRKVLGQTEGVILGRNPNDATYIIEDENISRKNTRLFIDDETLFVEDMDSANGTKVNGNELRSNIPQVLRDGDRLDVGPVSFVVTLE